MLIVTCSTPQCGTSRQNKQDMPTLTEKLKQNSQTCTPPRRTIHTPGMWVQQYSTQFGMPITKYGIVHVLAYRIFEEMCLGCMYIYIL